MILKGVKVVTKEYLSWVGNGESLIRNRKCKEGKRTNICISGSGNGLNDSDDDSNVKDVSNVEEESQGIIYDVITVES